VEVGEFGVQLETPVEPVWVDVDNGVEDGGYRVKCVTRMV